MSARNAHGTPDTRATQTLVACALVLVVGALYAQTAGHEFLSYDDPAYITENPSVRDGLGLRGLAWAFGSFQAANWHPLTWLSHMLDVQLFGLEPGPHHLVSAGLHALNAVLCFRFLVLATGALAPSALAALLFAVHPQRVESVAWAAERKDVLSGTFFFLTLLAYLRHAQVPSRARLALVTLLLALGLLAKPMLVTVPGVLLLLDLWPLGRWSFVPLAPAAPGFARAPLSTLLLEKVPLLVLALASSAVTVVAQRSGEALSSLEVFSFPERAATAVLGCAAYLRDALWPAKLAFFYPHPALVTGGEFQPAEARVLLTGLVLVALSACAWFLRRAHPVVAVGWAWMLVMLLPVCGLVQVGVQLYADRYAYLPLLGPTFALVFGLRELVGSAALRRGLFALGLAASAGLAAVTWRQVATWHDTGTLCARALEVTERNYVALEHLALQLQHTGDLKGARARYEETLAIAPQLVDVHSNFGTVLMQLGERERAVAEYQAALRLRPNYLHARLNWGMLYELAGDNEHALEQYRIAVEQHPESPSALMKLADVLLAQGKAAEAGEVYRRSLARPSVNPNAHAGLGEALAATGDEAGALAEFEQALAISGDLPRALHGEAWLLATTAASARRAPERALALLDRCPRGEAASWQHLRVLAASQAALGRFQEAARSAAEAAARAPASLRPPIEAERELYGAGRALAR